MTSIIEQILALDAIRAGERAAEQARFDAIPYPPHGHAQRLHVGRDDKFKLFAVDLMTNGDRTLTGTAGVTIGPLTEDEYDLAVASKAPDLFPLAADRMDDGRDVLICLAPGDVPVVLDVATGDPVDAGVEEVVPVMRRGLEAARRITAALASLAHDGTDVTGEARNA